MSEAMNEIRTRGRDLLEDSRKQHRDKAINNSRRALGCLDEIKYSVEVVTNIASKLKAKCAINVDDLAVLMYALSEHEDHISAFFKVNGALNGLIRELTGHHANKQLVATGCVCNLALGPSRSCLTIAKASGAYLMTYLQSQNRHILELCAWTIGNMAASNEKVAILLKNQGLFSNLLPLLGNNHEPKVIDAAAYAFSHILSSQWNILENHDIEEISTTIINGSNKSEHVFWLLYLLTSKDSAQNIFIDRSIFKLTVEELCNYSSIKKLLSDIIIVNCLIRIAANLCCKEVFIDNDTRDVIFSDKFVNLINLLLSCNITEIQNESLWLIGNIYKIAPHTVEKNTFFLNIGESLNKYIIACKMQGN